MIRIEHHHFHHSDKNEQGVLNELLTLTKKIMSKVTELEQVVDDLSVKVDTLQGSLDAEQEAIKGAVDGLNTTVGELNTTITDLKQQLADLGADTEAIDRIASKLVASSAKLDEIKGDLESTVA